MCNFRRKEYNRWLTFRVEPSLPSGTEQQHSAALKLISFLKHDPCSSHDKGRTVKRREMEDSHEYLFARYTKEGFRFVCSQ
jgi:hypothetical protein